MVKCRVTGPTFLAVPDKRRRNFVRFDPDALGDRVVNGCPDVLAVVNVRVDGDLVHGGNDRGGREELVKVLGQEV